ncbi:bile acid:sodium symporter family protein [Polyangium jinanense]|uniref:Bile acid:sodium symporter family protein n=1 Tax=Polyangium jinanense TaxID=2829994 RepID=A0A9X4AUB0_9BACT|nr:bile acid:sodium symporter family protein [Polyangium jinanense]MDC3957436.1 bile acid:sodium symporter family protein [Polyangium jinanense]MDC3985073.1 bile acid:sodium symporter family protein [Polyangium jinanense]
MQSNVFTAVFMPLALGVIMLGLGLGLGLEDFRRVVVYPRAVFVGLVCQTVLLPLACYGIAKGFGLPPELAVGLMLLAASPGGATANLFSHLAKGDVALNITLTATNSILSLFTLPFIVNMSLTAFLGTEKSIPLQFDKVIQVFAVVLVPVGIGMLIRAKRPAASDRLQKPVKIISAVFLVLIIVAAVLKERASLLTSFRQVGLAALVFNLVSMGIGYLVPLLVRLPKRQATAIGMEIGIHNGTLAIAIASAPTLLNNSTMAIPPAIYSLIMFFTAAAFGSIVARGNEESAPAEQPKAA